jgi:hypothetical protein
MGQAGRLPTSAPVSQIFPPGIFSQLTPNVQRLTKGDLIALNQWARTRQGQPPIHLTLQDIDSLEKAGDAMYAGTGAAAAADVTVCCCCSPCCTCTAAVVTQPVVWGAMRVA